MSCGAIPSGIIFMFIQLEYITQYSVFFEQKLKVDLDCTFYSSCK